MPNFLQTIRRDDLVTMSVLFASYVITAVLGGALFHAPAVIFPAAAVAFAGLVIGGIRLWPGITLASFVANIYQDTPLMFSLILAIAHTVQAVTGARLLQFFGFDPVFRRVRDMFTYMGTVFVSAAIVPGFVFTFVFIMNAFGANITLPLSWFSWWAGLLLVDLTLAAGLIRWMAKRDFVRTQREWIEIAAVGAAVAGTTYFLFWTDTRWMGGGVAILVYLVPLIWLVLRCGMRFTLVAFTLTSVIGIAGIIYGWQPEGQEMGRRILTSEIFIAAIAVIFYLFVAVVEERKRANRELRAQITRIGSLLEETKRQDRAKSEFISVFAHELRNPLAPIVSSVEILKLKWNANPELASVVDVIEDRTKTIVRLLDDLLDISRISQQRLKLKTENIDVGQHVHNVVRTLRPFADSHGLTFDLHLRDKLCVNADPVRFEQIVSNLCMNSIKYTDSGGRITVTVAEDGGNARISVRDTGIGIPREMLPRIFTPFAGLGVEHRHHSIKEGLGIGLSLTQQLVTVHKGTISAKSDGFGKGSEFTVLLPLVNAAPEPVIIPNSLRRTMNTTNSFRILVVDDNEAAANGLGTLLRHVGNTVEMAYVGADVEDKVREFQPDVVVLDIGLPDMSGYQVAEQLRTGGYDGRIIALTGYGQDEDKKKAEAAGFDHHLTKPVGLADLQAVLVPAA